VTVVIPLRMLAFFAAARRTLAAYFLRLGTHVALP